MMLRDILLSHALPAQSSPEGIAVRNALSSPWCWPQARGLQEKARACVSDPPQASMGEALLVSVSDGKSPRLCLWRLTRSPRGFFYPIIREARDALTLAEILVTRHLSLLWRLNAIPEPGEWQAQLLWKEGEGMDQALNGASFGVSMALAVASLALGVQAPSHIAASAALAPDGKLLSVEGLKGKLSIILGSALGVSQCIVARGQEEEARKIVSSLREKNEEVSLTVIGAGTLAEAFEKVFGPALKGDLPQWRSPEERKKAAEHLFRIALEGSSHVLNWRGVACAAEHLLARLSPEEIFWQKQTRFALRVARRHGEAQGNSQIAIPWPEEDELSRMWRPMRMRYLAHVIQAAMDSGSDDLPDYLKRAWRRFPQLWESRECDESELILRGAIGRGLAALRRYREAREILASTVEAWFYTPRPQESARALCELARVLGILGSTDREPQDGRAPLFLSAAEIAEEEGECEREALLQLEARAEVLRLVHSCDRLSLAFIRLALGRAWVQRGEAERALRHLTQESAEWVHTPAYLCLSRLRWYVRALKRADHRDEAQEQRDILFKMRSGNPWILLTSLDEALEENRDPTPILNLLRSLNLQALKQLDDPSLPAGKLARRIAMEYPY